MQRTSRTSPEADEEKGEGGVRAVARALDVLLAFQPGDDELLVSELLKRVDLSRPTLYRLLETLVAKQFLVSIGEPQRFRLGPAVAKVAHAWTSSLSYTSAAQPMMRNLWDATKETVGLYLLDGTYRVCVAELPSPHPLSFRRGVGHRDQLTVGASGRSILACFELSAKDLLLYGAAGGAAAARYMKDLNEIRSRGYALSREELIEGAVAVAAPFVDGSGQVLGSLCIYGPSVRMSDAVVQRFGKRLIDEAHGISQALGWRGKHPLRTQGTPVEA